MTGTALSVPPRRAGAELLCRRVRVARGLEPGDLLLRGASIVNVFSGAVEPGNVVVADGFIAGVGPYEWEAPQRIDAPAAAIIPGLIDAHIHLESTLLLPAALCRVVVPRGTTALISDPHEIANVMGVAGVELLLRESRGLPLDVYFMAPSCVPAVDWEDAAGDLDAGAVARLLELPGVIGLAEMMNFPGVLQGDAAVAAKIAAALARSAPVDGHAPGVCGRDLVAYAAAGIRSDHESVTAPEAMEKAALGMLVQVREGSIARNLETMVPLLVEDRLGEWCLCTDDVHPDELLERGHLDALLRRVVAAGVSPARAVRHASLVPARHYGLRDRGAVAPGYRADLVVVEDLEGFRATAVIKDGQVVARDGRWLEEASGPAVGAENTVHLAPLDASTLDLPLQGDRATVIGIVPGQIVTRRLRVPVKRTGGRFAFDPSHDVVVLASLERHRATGRVGLGLVGGLGFRRHGAIGSSVAHDSHNLIIAGTRPAEMLAAARCLEESGGGFVVVSDGAPAARLELPVAGLLSTLDARSVARGLREVRDAAAALGIRGLECPFGTLSFLALPVIPELKITTRGMFDVCRQEFVSA
jgi:adenine deaminase